MDRLNRALVKAGQIAQQYNESIERAREQQKQQQQQQQQQQYQQQYQHQQQHQQQQQYQQHQQFQQHQPHPQGQQHPQYQQYEHQNHSQGQQQHYNPHSPLSSNYDQPPPPPPRPNDPYRAPSASTYSTPPPSQPKSFSQQLQAAKLEANKVIASEMRKLQGQQQLEAGQHAETYQQRLGAKQQLQAAKLEANKVVASEMRKLQAQQQLEAGQHAETYQQRLEATQQLGADAEEAQRVARQLEEDRRAAEMLAAKFDAELRKAEKGMGRFTLGQADGARHLNTANTGPQSTPPLPPRNVQAPNPPATATSPIFHTQNSSASTPSKHLKVLPPPSASTPQKHVSGITPLTDCPDSHPVNLNLDYLVHDAAPRFTVCTRCYVDRIWNSPFRNSFSLAKFAAQEPRGCYFAAPRVKDQLWPAAVASTSLTNLLQYMIRRPTIEPCPKVDHAKDRKWYQANDCHGLAICPACYEDRIVGGPFERRFTSVHVPGGVMCSMAITYVSRMHDKFSAVSDWGGFCKEADARIKFPPCPKKDTVKNIACYSPRGGPGGLQLCVSCFCDHFHDTPSVKDFVKKPDGSSFTCSLGQLNVYLLAQEATRRRDLTLWWKGIREVDRNPPCSPKGTRTDRWYTLPSRPRGFAICGGCIAGIVEPLNASHFFVRANDVSPNQALLCAFSTGHSRLSNHLLLFLEMIFTGRSDPLANFAHRLGNVPSCPRQHLDQGKGRTWWGWEDTCICEECYITFAKDLHPNPPFQVRGQYIANTRMCDLYSPRMRGLYQQACATGDFTTFLRHAQERRKIYVECYLPARQHMINTQIALNQSQTMGIMGTAYKTIGMAQDATMGHWYTVGNAAVGYGHANEFSFQGAVYDQQSADLGAQATNPFRQGEMTQLYARWLAVE